MNDLARRWLAFALEDILVAEMALGEHLWNQVCFHSHQCAEKALKALVANRDEGTPRTHRLTDLQALLGEPGLEVFGDELRLLESFYIPTRYPDAVPGSLPEDVPGEQEARRALRTAQKVLDVVHEIGGA